MIVSIVGPTAVGKTKLSVELAKKYNGIIINADSVQIYKELNVGSAKIKEEEKEGITHYLLDIKSITEEYNIVEFQKDIRQIIDDNKDKNIFIVGGSGLYISAALYDYKFPKNIDSINYDELSNEELMALVLKKDPSTTLHINNKVRLINFLKQIKTQTNGNKLLYDVCFIGLTTSRETLYEKINERVLKMFDNGLEQEVQNLIKYKEDSRILKSAIGYKEVIGYISNECTYAEMVENIQKNSRRFAKRQYTWFNNKIDVTWVECNYENFNKSIIEAINIVEVFCRQDNK